LKLSVKKMKTSKPRKMVQCEIVSVTCSQFLVNSKRLACRYETDSGDMLANGHYLVVWPAGTCRSSYGRELRYFGPHATADAARLCQVSALWMEIAEPAPDKVGTPSHDLTKSHHSHHFNPPDAGAWAVA
jgi:hypothetical protein